MTNKKDYAFPFTCEIEYGDEGQTRTQIHSGLTKREYFAAMAMQGLLTRVPERSSGETDLGVIESDRIAEESVIMANKLIAAINKNS